ncbi:MAG: hypothetical protein AAB553_01305 [Patescibacteria group bacterium]
MGNVPSHDSTSFTDTESIGLINKVLASHKRVMPRLFSIDKWPNIDGYVDVQDIQNIFVGTLFVQAKTLPINHKLKFACPISFFTYCEINPCLLLGVDNKNEKIYWLYFDAQTIKKISLGKNKYTKTINFNPQQYLDKNTIDYIDAWEILTRNHIRKYQNFDELKKAYDTILKNSNPALGKVQKSFINAHFFLDRLNSLIDNEFKIVKNIYYPKTWKIGLAYYEYIDTSVIYTLYPIGYDTNDVQIKEVDDNLHNQITREGLGFTGHSIENPIEKRPTEYAKEIIQPKVLKIVEKKLLSHKGSDFLAREFIFAFIDEFNIQMGLEKRDEYSIVEIERAFNIYLPLWLKEAFNFLVEKDRNNFKQRINFGRIRYLDPTWINEIINDERNEIRDKVDIKLKNNQKITNVLVGNDKMPFGLFVEFLNLLKQDNKKIKRPYKARDYSRLGKGGGWVWDMFSKVDATYNLKNVFTNLESVYSTIINNNFPYLKKELSLFEEADKIIVFWNVKDRYNGIGTGPTYSMYFLQSQIKNEKKTLEILEEDQIESFSKKDIFEAARNPEIKFRSNNYKILSIRNSVLDFIYEDSPMLNLAYMILEKRLKEYFNTKSKSS